MRAYERFLLIGVLAALGIAGMASGAEAASVTTYCSQRLYPSDVNCDSCTITFSGARPVTVTIDIYTNATQPLRWELGNASGTNCFGYVTPSDPAKTWTCTYVPSGSWKVRVWGVFGKEGRITLSY